MFNNAECFIYDSESTIDSSAVIYGYEDSSAEKYANEYNRKFAALVTRNNEDNRAKIALSNFNSENSDSSPYCFL